MDISQYTFLLQDKLSLIAYIFITLSLAALLFNKKVTYPLLLLAIISGLIASRINIIGLLGISISFIIFYYTSKINNKFTKFLLNILSLLVVYAYMLHIAPGYHNWSVITGEILSPNSIPYTMYFNFDKSIIAVLVGLLLINNINNTTNYKKFFKYCFITLVSGLAIVGTLSYKLNLINFEPKLSPWFLLWAANNLFVVCLVEEIIFRGWLQNRIASSLKYIKFNHIVAIIISSILFGLMHYRQGSNLIIISALAGLHYGYVYKKTGKLQASILVHFLINTVHFIGFTYPALR